jgi:glucose/mannose transport system substrate-binding protein
MKSVGIALAALLAALTAASAAPADLELLRPADVGASAPALAVLKQAMAAKGFTLRESSISGGDNALAAAIAGDKARPAAALLNGYEVRALADQRKLNDITAAAQTGRWPGLVLLPTQPFLVYRDRWVAVALDVTPLNGLWINANLMDKIGGATPETLDGLFVLLDRARQAGVPPLAMSTAPRDLALLFEQALISTGGPEVYKHVFVDVNEMAVRSDAVTRAFETLAHLKSYVAAGGSSPDEKGAAEKVVKGETLAVAGPSPTRLLFAAAGKTADKDYRCQRFPGSGGAVLFDMDIVAMLKAGPDAWAGQTALAETVMDADVQVAASLAAGGVPVRAGVDTSKFDDCAAADLADVQQAAATSALLGSTAHGFTQRASVTSAYVDVIAKFYSGEIKTAEAATEALAAALTASR